MQFLLALWLFLQNVEMADQFRKDGKIYVVVAIVLVVMAVFFYYLVRTDSKITRLEKERLAEEEDL